MTRLRSAAGMGLAGAIVAMSLATSPGCDSCRPLRLKEMDLKPIAQRTGTSGPMGSMGYCLSAGDVPSSSFSPGTGQVMVGFDDFFRAGSDPFPCDDLRASVFRGGVLFDLAAFDVLATATFSFETARSISRANGETVGSIPGQSVATTLGIATQAFTPTMPETGLMSMTAGPNVAVTVTGPVGDWATKAVPNFGFVIGGPTGLVDNSNPPKNNNASLSWYQKFNLHILYNPALNPRAPQ